jgi:hypothetical protein
MSVNLNVISDIDCFCFTLFSFIASSWKLMADQVTITLHSCVNGQRNPNLNNPVVIFTLPTAATYRRQLLYYLIEGTVIIQVCGNKGFK